MDEQDAIAFATVAGAMVSPPFYAKGKPYAALLEEVIDRHRLKDFFEWAPGHADHYAIRPRGYGEVDHEAFVSVVKQWRRAYRKLDEPKQMFLASIIWLYSGGDRCIWLKGLTRSWGAVDAIKALREKGMLADWARLFAMYPGW